MAQVWILSSNCIARPESEENKGTNKRWLNDWWWVHASVLWHAEFNLIAVPTGHFRLIAHWRARDRRAIMDSCLTGEGWRSCVDSPNCGHDATTLLELIDWLTWFNMWEPFKGGIETHQNAQKYTVDLSFIIKYNFIMICSLLFSLLNSWPRPQGRDRESACPAFRPVLLHSYSSFLQVAGHPWSKSAQ